MSFTLLDARSTREALARSGGGKALGLADLERLGCAVPTWFCLPAEAFDAAAAAAETVRRGGGSTGRESIPMPHAVARTVRRALAVRGLAEAFVAVRSSGLDEDGTEHSFAGQFSSFLYRRGADAVLEAVAACWASAFSTRIRAYREAVGAEAAAPRMGVIIQRMVESHVAGVAFSRDPTRPGDRDALIVEALWGQGEGLVGGGLDADHFDIHRETLDFEATVAAKTHRVVQDRVRGGTRTAPLNDDRADRSSLTPDQVREVAALALRLESELGGPQDCEWAFAEGRLFVLQTRPITTLPPDALFDPRIVDDEVVIWDNSNIIESYAGVTTPLTFSHVSRAYREVYHQSCRLMSVPPAVVERHRPVFRNTLGLIRGRIYYNLLNWYRMLALFPVLGRSGAFMETMMGVKQSLEADLQPLFDTVAAEAPRYGLLRRLALACRLCVALIGGRRANEDFLHRVDRVCRPLEETDLAELGLGEQMAVYRRLEEELLRHWTAPIVNDTRCMIAFGLLERLTVRWLGETVNGGAASLQNDLFCGEQELKSTEPMRLLVDIARDVESDPELREWFLETDPEALWAALQDDFGGGDGDVGDLGQRLRSGLGPRIRDRFGRYVRAYGHRCVDELKLESRDFHDRPHLLVASVQGYLRHGVPSLAEIDARKETIRHGAEERVRLALRGPRRIVYRKVLAWARAAVRDRELLRFERTRTFGIVRRLFRGVGHNLSRLGVLADPDAVFYLTVEEILAFVEGRAVSLALGEVAEARKREFDGYRESPHPPDRFFTKGAVGASLRYPSLLLDRDLLPDLSGGEDPDVLRGTSCCPGVVEAPVRVAERFEDTGDMDGEILVTKRTDPGWVPIFPSCSGLIIERGGLLSHSAVVARELGIPTIVGVGGSPLERLITGQRVRLDAGKGEVRIL